MGFVTKALYKRYFIFHWKWNVKLEVQNIKIEVQLPVLKNFTVRK